MSELPETCFYCDRKTYIYCENCQKPICNYHGYTLYYDCALDADDNYGDFYEVYICKEECE